MRFEAASPVSKLVQTVPHVAFEVDDIDEALEGKQLLSPPGPPSPGVRVAMILDDGCPIELIEFTGKKRGTASGRARTGPGRSRTHNRKRGEP